MKNISVICDKQKIGFNYIEGWAIKDNSRLYYSNEDPVTLEEQTNGQIFKKELREI